MFAARFDAQFANKQSSVAIISSINDFSDYNFSRCLFSISRVKHCNTTIGRGRLHVIHDDFIPFSHFIDLGPSAKGNGQASMPSRRSRQEIWALLRIFRSVCSHNVLAVSITFRILNLDFLRIYRYSQLLGLIAHQRCSLPLSSANF